MLRPHANAPMRLCFGFTAAKATTTEAAAIAAKARRARQLLGARIYCFTLYTRRKRIYCCVHCNLLYLVTTAGFVANQLIICEINNNVCGFVLFLVFCFIFVFFLRYR